MTAPTAIQIPIIDFTPFISNDEAGQQAVAQEIYWACHQTGFLYLKNHGIPQAQIQQMFEQSQQLFGLPPEAKQRLAWSDEFSNRGYVGVERERLDPNQPGDLKEAFNIGREGPDATSADPNNAALTQNQWPAELPEFRPTALAFFDACTAAADRVFHAFALALNLPASFIADRHLNQEHTLRLLHYPPMQVQPKPGQIRAGAHSDYGSITLLFQDEVGGLEVKTASGDWIDAPSIPDTILVNTGDLTQRWSNRVFCSTQHRVGLPKRDRATRSRYSIAFFCQPDHEAEIACLETCQGPENPPLYPPIKAGEYLISLLQATY